ncbi:MAG: mechanosensitive ion channel family protein [Bacillota bacterium]
MNHWYAAMQEMVMEHWQAWAFFAGYLVLSWVVAALARRLLKGLIPRLTARSSTTLDDRLVGAAAGPVRLTILAVGFRMALEALKNRIPSFGEVVLNGVPAKGEYATEFGWVETLAVGLVILAVTSLVNGLMRAAVDWYLHELAGKNEATWDEELLPLIRRVLSLLVYFIGLSVIFEKLGFNITALITTAGVASLAVALAAQETLSNMLGGLTILVDRPFRVGDWIELADGKMGEVVEIGLRSTRIRQFDGNALVVPNKDMANTRIINYAQPTVRSAVRQTIGVSYGSDIEKAKRVLLETISSHPEVLQDPAPGVWFTTFGASSLDLFMSCWVESYRDRFRVTDELNVMILKAFRENGIEIPFPQQDVHLFVKEGPKLSVDKEP